MIVKDFINEHLDDYIYVGVKSGWCFIGYGRDFIDKAKQFDEDSPRRGLYGIKIARKTLEQKKTDLQTAIDRKTYFGNVSDLEMRAKKRAVESAEEYLERKILESETYIPFMERYIVDSYTHYTSPRGLAIIIDAPENGNYFFLGDKEGTLGGIG